MGWILFNFYGIYLILLHVEAKPFTYDYHDQRTDKTYTIYGFDTFGLPLFAVLFNEWYTNVEGKSIKHLPAEPGAPPWGWDPRGVPTNISDLLTPVARALPWPPPKGGELSPEGMATAKP